MLEKTLESPLDCKEIQPVHPKWDQSWVFIGRTDVEAETPILWPPDAKSWLIWKDPDAGKDWRWEEKGMTNYKMVGWHHRRNGHEFEWAPGVGDGQGSQACCSPWSCRVGHEWVTELSWVLHCIHVPHFLNPFICQWTFSLFLVMRQTPTLERIPRPVLHRPHSWLWGSDGSVLPGPFWILILKETAYQRYLLLFLFWKSLSHVRLFATLWTIRSMEFSRPEYWSG